MKRTVVACGVALLGLWLHAGAAGAAPQAGELILEHDAQRGAFDPSLTTGPSGPVLVLSLIEPAHVAAKPHAGVVQTYLAQSTDGGRRWRASAAPINKVTPFTVVEDGEKVQGHWHHEVPAVVYDAYAEVNARWKLFWHQYPQIAGKRSLRDGWIAYKAAAIPTGLADAVPVKLFVGRGNKGRFMDSRALPPPITDSPVLVLNKLHRDLSSCVVFSELSALAKEDGLYLALICYHANLPLFLKVKNKVVLLKCARPCQPQTPGAWTYLGAILDNKDAKRLGHRKFSAANLFSRDGTDYIMVSPVDNKPWKNAYQGCMVFAFEDLAAARLRRSGDGRPTLVSEIRRAPNTFNGACTYVPETGAGGVLIGQVEVRAKTPYFRLYWSGQQPAP